MQQPGAEPLGPGGPPYGRPGYPGAPWMKPQPMPRGPPTRAPFLAGAVGHFLAAGGAIAYGIGAVVAVSPGAFLILLAPIFSGALLVQLPGFWGFRRNYGSRMGLATFVYGLAAVTFFLIVNIILVAVVPGVFLGGVPLVLFIAAFVTLGALFILQGVAFILVRRFVGSAGLSLATGILFIIAGSFIAVILGIVLGGFFLLVVPMIMGGITLLLAPVPSLPVQYGPGVAVPPTAPPPAPSQTPTGPPVDTPPQPAVGSPALAEPQEFGARMSGVMARIDELERSIREQEAFLTKLEDRLVEGTIDNPTYDEIKQSRSDHLAFLKEELDRARREFPPSERGERGKPGDGMQAQ